MNLRLKENGIHTAKQQWKCLNKVCCLLMMISLISCQNHTVYQCDDKMTPPPLVNFQNQIIENPPTFREFVAKFNKSYSEGSVQYQFRCDIYYEHLVQLQEKAKTVTWKVGVNHMADWTDQQEKSFRNLKTDNLLLKTTNSEKIQVRVGAPESLDWRQKNAVTKIKNQGSCGSCWSFATAAYGQSRLLIRGETDPNIDLSEQYLLKCTSDSDCDGGYLQSVFQTAASGVPTESAYSYSPKFSISPWICFTTDKIFFGHFPKKMYKLQDSEIIALLQKEPVAISISSDNWRDYQGGVFSCNSQSKIDHAVLLVGYNSDYWIVKNQWGEDWGEQGYIRISRNPRNNCKIGAGVFTMSLQNFVYMWSIFVGALLLFTGLA